MSKLLQNPTVTEGTTLYVYVGAQTLAQSQQAAIWTHHTPSDATVTSCNNFMIVGVEGQSPSADVDWAVGALGERNHVTKFHGQLKKSTRIIQNYWFYCFRS